MRIFTRLFLMTLFLSQTAMAVMTPPKFLQFILPAKEAKLSVLDASKGTYTLRLKGAETKVTYFTNKPRRIVDSMSTAFFLKRWDKPAPHAFVDTPPNLAVIHKTPSGTQSLILQFIAKQYDLKTNALSFTVKPTKNGTNLPTKTLSDIVLTFAEPTACGVLGAWGNLPGEKQYDLACHAKEQVYLKQLASASTRHDGYATLGDEKIYFSVQGTGEKTLVFIHGLPLEHTCWQCQVEHFSKRYQTISIDLPGYGKSSKLQAADLKVVSMHYADAIDAVLKAQHIKKATYIGASLGGHVALAFAHRYPQKLERLVLINTSPRFSQAKDWPMGFSKKALKTYSETIKKESMDDIAKLLINTATSENCSKALLPLRENYYTLTKQAGKATLLAFFQHIALEDFREYLPTINVPTLIISGTLSQEVTGHEAVYMRLHMPQAQLLELNGADQFIYGTMVSKVNEMIDNFFEPQCDICSAH